MCKMIFIIVAQFAFISIAAAQWEVDEWGWIIPGSEENQYFPPSGNTVLNMPELDNFPIFEGERSAVTTAPVCCDFNDDGTYEMIVCNDDGWIHCFEPDGSEMDGWPQDTQWRIYEPAAETLPSTVTSSPSRTSFMAVIWL